MKSKYFSPLFGLAALAVGFVGSDYCFAITDTHSDEVYNDSLYIESATSEIPGSFESSAREQLAQDDLMNDAGADRALESMADLDQVAPVKKASARRHRHSIRN